MLPFDGNENAHDPPTKVMVPWRGIKWRGPRFRRPDPREHSLAHGPNVIYNTNLANVVADDQGYLASGPGIRKLQSEQLPSPSCHSPRGRSASLDVYEIPQDSKEPTPKTSSNLQMSQRVTAAHVLRRTKVLKVAIRDDSNDHRLGDNESAHLRSSRDRLNESNQRAP